MEWYWKALIAFISAGVLVFIAINVYLWKLSKDREKEIKANTHRMCLKESPSGYSVVTKVDKCDGFDGDNDIQLKYYATQKIGTIGADRYCMGKKKDINGKDKIIFKKGHNCAEFGLDSLLNFYAFPSAPNDVVSSIVGETEKVCALDPTSGPFDIKKNVTSCDASGVEFYVPK